MRQEKHPEWADAAEIASFVEAMSGDRDRQARSLACLFPRLVWRYH